MFGEYCQVRSTLDAKGRLGLPAKLRHAIGSEGIDVLVLNCVDGAIRAFTPGYFRDRVEGPFRERSPFDPEAQSYYYTVLADAESCNIDGQGRIRIPQRLQELAGLDRECVVVSIMDWVEIWNPEQWEEARKRASFGFARGRGLQQRPE